MRLVYVTASFPYGTAEPFLVPEITELKRQGHAVVIVPLRRNGPLELRDVAALLPQTCAMPVVDRAIASAAGRELARGRRAVAPLGIALRSRNPRILVKNLAAYPKALWLARTARELKIDHIHAHRASVASTLAMLAGAAAAIPWSFTAHRWDIFENNLLGEKVRRARFVRFIARAGVDEARPMVGDAMDGKAVVVHMGVPLPPAGAAAQPAHDAVLLCPGSLIRRKGQHVLLDALAMLARDGIEPTLWLAGQGPDANALRAQAVSLGLDGRVQFLGQVPQRELIEMYRAGRVLAVVLPSLHEGIPVALMEAMSCGIPVISTRAGGTPELLEGGAGCLVPPGDARALADAVATLVRDADLRRRLAASGRVRVEREFAIERVVADLVELFSTR